MAQLKGRQISRTREIPALAVRGSGVRVPPLPAASELLTCVPDACPIEGSPAANHGTTTKPQHHTS